MQARGTAEQSLHQPRHQCSAQSDENCFNVRSTIHLLQNYRYNSLSIQFDRERGVTQYVRVLSVTDSMKNLYRPIREAACVNFQMRLKKVKGR